MTREEIYKRALAKHAERVGIDEEGHRRYGQNYRPVAGSRPTMREAVASYVDELEQKMPEMSRRAQQDGYGSAAAHDFSSMEYELRVARIELAQRIEADARARDRALAPPEPAPPPGITIAQAEHEKAKATYEYYRRNNPIAAAAFYDRYSGIISPPPAVAVVPDEK